MDTPLLPIKVDLENVGPEVRSYIYQTILEFEPYTTPNTTVTIVAKDPERLATEIAFEDIPVERLRRMWRIAIVMSEEGTQILEEGLHEDIYVAIRIAKEKLLKTMSEIQDHITSNQDRIIQINNALAGTQLH